MLIDLKQYAEAAGVTPIAIRQRISRAKIKKQDILTVLPAVVSATQFGGTWAFTVDKKKFKKVKELFAR